MAGELVRTGKRKTGAREGSSPCCDAQGEANRGGEVVVAEIDVGDRR
jgi:hypothetical protein